MALEKKNGAGTHLSGVLERATPPRPQTAATAEAGPEHAGPQTADDAEPPPRQGRGGSARSKTAATAARQAKKIKGRTIYMPDDLFERVMVQSHRKDMTISDYVAWLLNRHVPDHRGRAEADA